MRLYLDTSVAGGYFDEEFGVHTRHFFELVKKGSVTLIIGDALVQELRQAPPRVRQLVQDLPSWAVERQAVTTTTRFLAQQYLHFGVLSARSAMDAIHVATATAAAADAVVSWNFKHMVNLERILGFSRVNASEGFPPIDVRTPREIFDES